MKKPKREATSDFELGKAKNGFKIILADSFFNSLSALNLSIADKKKLLEEIKGLDFTKAEPYKEKKRRGKHETKIA